MNTKSTTFPKDLSDRAVQYIESFGINWYCIDNLGEASNFIHSYKQTQQIFEKLQTKELIAEIEKIAPVDTDDEMAFTKHNQQIVLEFLKAAKQLQDKFLDLDTSPNFVESLSNLKIQSSKLNFINARAIIYHNCLA